MTSALVPVEAFLRRWWKERREAVRREGRERAREREGGREEEGGRTVERAADVDVDRAQVRLLRAETECISCFALLESHAGGRADAQ